MSDPLTKVKQKLQDEITTLEHEMNIELPKELMKARAHMKRSFRKRRVQVCQGAPGICVRAAGATEKTAGRRRHVEFEQHSRETISGYGVARLGVGYQKISVEVEYKLVTTEEADASQGLISTTSPIGKALLGRHVGDEVHVQTPAGIKEFEVVRIKTIHEDV